MKAPVPSPFWFALLASLCLCWSPTVARGGEVVENDTSALVDLLASDRADEVSQGEQLVSEHRAAYLTVLLERLRTGDIETKGKAVAELGVVISPWIRGKEAHARYYFFEVLRRPVERMPQLPEASDLRQALQAAIADLLKKGETPSKDSLRIKTALGASCEALGEVADDQTMGWVLEQLSLLKDPYLAAPILELAESYLGIPPIFRPGLTCGNSTPAEFEDFQRSQQRAFAEARGTLAKQWDQVRPMKSGERIAFAITSWRDHFVPLQRSQSGHYRHDGWLFSEMEPLVRFGTPAVKALRAQLARETEPEVKAVWEAVIATITGHEDSALVRQLFNGTDAQRELACEIVVCATSRDWLTQLDALQFRGGFQTGKASDAIAICHRDEGLPALKRAFEGNRANFQAKCAVEVLEKRAASAAPRGIRRFQF